MLHFLLNISNKLYDKIHEWADFAQQNLELQLDWITWYSNDVKPPRLESSNRSLKVLNLAMEIWWNPYDLH